jgi:hypothetical protein
MPATVITSTVASGVEFGLLQETGLLLNSFSRSVQSDKATVMDALGDTVAVAYFNKTATISLDGVVNGGVAYELANILTLANDTTSYGVSGGSVIVDTVAETTGAGTFKTINVSATQYPEID